MKKLVCWLSVLMMLLSGIANAAEAKNESAAEQSADAYSLYCKAYTDYISAKTATDIKERDTLYAQAIESVNRSLQSDRENSTYLMLASQLYRSKGANGFARQYFMSAEQNMLKRLEEEPNSIEYNLDYAIACYAGDVRFWSTYPEYEVKAQQYAKRVLALCAVEEPIDNRENLIHMAMAQLILGQQEQCRTLLLLAGADEPSSDISADTDMIGLYQRLYDNTVLQKQWIWEVRETSVDKEFLLYYLADLNWNK